MKETIKSGIILFLVALVASAALSMVNEVTKEAIAAANKAAEEESKGAGALKLIFADATDFTDIEETDYGVSSVRSGVIAKNNGADVGYIFYAYPSGYGGEIELLVALDINAVIKKVNVLNHSETPGLGSKIIDDENFLLQFNEKPTPVEDMTAIAGATISSVAVKSGIDDAINAFFTLVDPSKAVIKEEAVELKKEDLFPDATEYEELPEMDYGNTVSKVELAKNGSEELGYIFTANPTGYGGKINTLVAIDMNGIVKGMSVLSHSETTNLGEKAVLPDYLQNYYEKTGEFKTVKETSTTDTEIQSVTGATISSETVTKAVNHSLAALAIIKDPSSAPAPEEPEIDVFSEANTFNEVTIPEDLKLVEKITTIQKDDELLGYAVTTKTTGYGGKIEVTTSLQMDGSVASVVIGSHEETENLGSKIVDKEFTNQFKGITQELANDSIELITGATLSSEAVTKGINQAIKAFALITPAA